MVSACVIFLGDVSFILVQFLTWKDIFQVVEVDRIYSIILFPSLPNRHLETLGELSYEKARNARRKLEFNS